MSSAFSNAPISNFVVLASAIVSIIGLTFNVKELFWLDMKGLAMGQYWRLMTFPFSFIGFSEMLFGLPLLYSFRTLERQLGSSKFGVFVILSFLVSSLLVLILLFTTSNMGADPRNELVFSGPYALIFGALVLYYYYIPPMIPVPFFGIRFTDKVFTYIAAVILALSHPPSSIYYAYCGIFSGLLYRTKTFESLLVPLWLTKICSKYISPILTLFTIFIENQSSPQPQAQAPAHPQQPPIQSQQRPTRNVNTNPSVRLPAYRPSNVFDFDTVHTFYSQPQPVRQPSQENIEYLISMGVDRETAVETLIRYDDELHIAIESLFPSL
jgi:membrane associated rhomboid family serine protease